MLIKRSIEKRVDELLVKFPVIGILGPRQVGKTTLAKKLNPNKKVLYLDLELNKDINKLNDPEYYFNLHKDKCIILDEVQRMPELFPILRGCIDQHRVPGRFILLGSASPNILKNSSESLAGRIYYIELTGLNFSEMKNIMSVENLFLKGGFPEPLLSEDDRFQKDWHTAFIKSLIERDLPGLGLDASHRVINNFISMLSNNQGGMWNASSYGNSLGVSNPTVLKYRDFLEYTYLIRVLYPFFSNAKKRLVKSPKIYIRDSGILHQLLGLNDLDSLMGHQIVGSSWENFVIEQIISQTENQFDYHFYRTQKGAECDLVILKGTKPWISIEVKFTIAPKRTKSFTESIKDLGTSRNFIIIPQCPDPYPLDENIMISDLENLFKLCPELLLL